MSGSEGNDDPPPIVDSSMVGDSNQQRIDWNNPPLFKPDKIRVKAYWDVISLVAPSVDATKEWKTNDAIKAYCTKCKIPISWSVKNPKQVQRHMTKYHGDILAQTKKRKESVIAAEGEKTINHFFSKKLKKDLPFANKADQNKGEVLLVKWVAESLRPFTIVEDAGFRDLVAFFCNLHKQFSVPSRNKIRNQLVNYGELVRKKMRETIKDEITYFSSTTDIWSSRTMESFMAITLHGLTKDFDVIIMTLAVDPLVGKHTGDFIRVKMSDSFNEWGLKTENLTLMLRDNASNAVKACNDWGIKHFGCIGHCLHLIVGPLFVEKKSGDAENEQFLDDTVDYDEEELLNAVDSFDDVYKAKVKHVSKVVGNFRKVTKYIRKSTIAKEKLDGIQRTNAGADNVLSLDLDVRTRWNSTLYMLQKLVRLKTFLCIFLQCLKSPEGRREFNRKSLPSFSEKNWGLIEGLCIILKIFGIATAALGGEKYPTFVYAMPVLCSIKRHLSNDVLLTRHSNKDDVKQFYMNYGGEPFLPSILATLEAIRLGLLSEFQNRFRGMIIDIQWTTILDSRCRSLKHLNTNEKQRAKTILIEEVVDVIKAENVSEAPTTNFTSNDDHDISAEIHDALNIFDSPVKAFSTGETENSDNEDTIRKRTELISATAKRGVENYLDHTILVDSGVNSLNWWKSHKHRFPRISILARNGCVCLLLQLLPKESSLIVDWH